MDRRSVHPHVRGEDSVWQRFWVRFIGSPPRAWGRRPRLVPDPRRARFTPTCVGKTWQRPTSTAPRTVHPHVRGEDLSALGRNRGGAGSPPRAWGRLLALLILPTAVRFTPTCVGKTSVEAPCFALCAVHPHVRGEDDKMTARQRTGYGSPPRAWGRRERVALGWIGDRFTPTCVGKTATVTPLAMATAVHPHVRGEDSNRWTAASTPAGSPPRAWGRLGARRVRGFPFRFTPTCVGKTSSKPGSTNHLPVHPHVRGEDCGF